MRRDTSREDIYRAFLTQASHFADVRDVNGLPHALVELRYQGRPVLAVCLVHSSDYWYHRLHLSGQPVGLLIVGRHDTIVPVAVLSLEDGREYAPEDMPARYALNGGSLADLRRSHATAPLILGALLCGIAQAHALLPTLPDSTRRAYEKKMQAYQRRRRGRPLAF